MAIGKIIEIIRVIILEKTRSVEEAKKEVNPDAILEKLGMGQRDEYLLALVAAIRKEFDVGIPGQEAKDWQAVHHIINSVVFHLVKKIIAELSDLKLDQVTPASRLTIDLGLDSLDAVDLQMSIDDEFNINVSG